MLRLMRITLHFLTFRGTFFHFFAYAWMQGFYGSSQVLWRDEGWPRQESGFPFWPKMGPTFFFFRQRSSNLSCALCHFCSVRSCPCLECHHGQVTTAASPLIFQMDIFYFENKFSSKNATLYRGLLKHPTDFSKWTCFILSTSCPQKMQHSIGDC